MKRERASFNLKPETLELIELASECFNENKSSIVDEAIQFRLNYLFQQVGKYFDLEDLRIRRNTKKLMKEKKNDNRNKC